jgi:4,5:9,10-diseco-3-hydroxy-5,9,17-trioxoandrosta-1(10),2-diene-4-oate hydrolase
VIDVVHAMAAPDLKRKAFEIDTIPVIYTEAGEGDPVVLLHLPVNPMHVYKKTVPALAEHFHVYTLDLRPIVACWYYEGYGSLLRYVTDYLSKALDHLGLRRVPLVASFMGSGVAMSLAIREPERVSRLVLISALGLTTRPKTSVFGLVFGLMNLPGMRALFHLFMSNMAFQRATLKFDRKIFGPTRVNEFFYEAPTDGLDYHLSHLYDGLGDPPNPFAFETFINVIQHLRYREIQNLISTIEQETLLLFGEEDILIPPHIARQYKATIPNSELHFVPKTRVFLHWEAADQVNTLITNFLRK